MVGTKLSYEGKTGNALAHELINMGFSYIDWTGSVDRTQGILGVKVYDKDSGEPVKAFSPEQNVRFVIETKKKPVEKKKKKSSNEENNTQQEPRQNQDPTEVYDSDLFK